jgi:chorismate mutase
MTMRGVRGATTAEANTRAAILDATRELLQSLVRVNQMGVSDIVSAYFTVTADLDAAFPARAARELGWKQVALLDAQAPRVEGDLSRCIRVLIHWNSDRPAVETVNVYLREARQLRPDLILESMP